MRPLRPTGPRIRRPQGRWTDWAILILSIWLFMSPWVLSTIVVTTRGPDGKSFMARGANPGDFWGVGAALFVVALWALTTPWARWMEQSAALLAVWLFISPWVLGFALFRAAWDAWIVAILVWLLALAALAVITTRVRLASAHGTGSVAPRSPPDTMITPDRVSHDAMKRRKKESEP